MPRIAFLAADIPSANADAGNIVRGCQMAKLGKLATFRNLKGETEEIMITPVVVSGLLALFALAGTATAHWSHDWIEKGEDGIKSKVATFKDFRVENGDLVADAHLWPTDKKEAILHAAQFDPTGMMVSTVFSYDGGKFDAVPTIVHAADFVERGASTTALCAKLSEDTNPTPKKMEPTEFLKMLSEALKDPTIHAAVKAMVKENEPVDPTTDTDAAAMEEAAGVKPEDKKDDEKDKPAIMRAILNIGRATRRQIEASKESAAVLAEAKFTTALGTGKFKLPAGKSVATDLPFTASLKAHLATGAARGVAILRAKNDAKPGEYDAWENAGRPMPT